MIVNSLVWKCSGRKPESKVVPVRDMKALDGDEWPASVPGHFIRNGNQSRYPLNSRLDGPQSQSACFRGKKNTSTLPVMES